MHKLTKTLATLSATALLVPGLVLAETGTQSWTGRGIVQGSGQGGVEFVGNGTLKITTGGGSLTVSPNAIVKIKGEGVREETDDGIIYTGINGTVMVKGTNVHGEFDGEVEKFRLRGKGTVTVSGDGEVKARGNMTRVAGADVMEQSH